MTSSKDVIKKTYETNTGIIHR